MSHLSINTSEFSEALKVTAAQPLDPVAKNAAGHANGTDKSLNESLQKPFSEHNPDAEHVQKEASENKGAPVEVRLPDPSEQPEGSHPLNKTEEQVKPEQTSSTHFATDEFSVDDKSFEDLLNHAIDSIDSSGIDMDALSSHINDLVEKNGGDLPSVLEQLLQEFSGLHEQVPETATTNLPETGDKKEAPLSAPSQKVIESPFATSIAPESHETSAHQTAFAAAAPEAVASQGQTNNAPSSAPSSGASQISEGSLGQVLSQNAGATAVAMNTVGTTMSTFSLDNLNLQQGEADQLKAAAAAAQKALNHLLHEGFWERLWQKIEKPFFKVIEACMFIGAVATGRVGLAVMIVTVAVMAAHSSQIGNSIAKDLMHDFPNMSKQKAEAIGSGIATAIVAVTALVSGQVGSAFESAPEAAATITEKADEEAKTIMAKIGKLFSAIGGALQTINPFRYLPTWVSNASFGMARGWASSHLTTNILKTITFNDPSEKTKVEAIVYSVTIFVDLVVTAGTMLALMEKPVGNANPNAKLIRVLEAVKFASGLGMASSEIGEAVPNAKSAIYTNQYARNQELIKHDQYLLNSQSQGNKSNEDVNSKIISNYVQMLATLATAPGQAIGAFAQDMIA
ncbi:MAG: hypothetical protein JSR39_02245 [Verrucomicrobia bacterium]|nr:hypothetical protein [Verrucomicrobiota bacterium]